MKYRINQPVILIGSKLYPEHIGEPCVVVAIGVKGTSLEPRDYGIVFDNIPTPSGYLFWAADEWQLAPRFEPGSWDELEGTIGWNPTKETEVDRAVATIQKYAEQSLRRTE